MEPISVFAAVILASSGFPSIFGATTAANMARISTTTMTSISVKPDS